MSSASADAAVADVDVNVEADQLLPDDAAKLPRQQQSTDTAATSADRGDGPVEVVLADDAMRKLFRYVDKHRSYFVWACVWSTINKVFDLFPPLLTAWIIDSVDGNTPGWIADIAGTEGESAPWSLAVALAIIVVIVHFLESFAEWVHQLAFKRLAQLVQHDLRTSVYAHLQSMEMAFFDNHRLGETLSMLNDDVNQLERFLNEGFNVIFQLFVMSMFACITLFSTSWELALIGLAPLPVIAWTSVRYHFYVQPLYRTIRNHVGLLSSRLENNIAGMSVIKSFTAEQFERDRVCRASQQYRDANIAALRVSTLYIPVVRMGVALGFGGVVLVGVYWRFERPHKISVGDLVLFCMLIQRVLWPLTRLGQTIDDFERTKSSACRTFGLLERVPTIRDAATVKSLGGGDGGADGEHGKNVDAVGHDSNHKPARANGEIEFRNVNFGYHSSVQILRDFNLHIKAGEFIGVAGSTGAGKSTLVRLLLRLHDVNAGAVHVDGVDIRSVAMQQLRQNIAIVSQDVYLFYGSIFENIAYGSDLATASHTDAAALARVKAAAKAASLDSFIATLPDEYGTFVGERGIKLSGGQRQRLSLARAILKDAPILVLDEATSSVDTETERVIQENLRVFTANRTAIVIAHRLSTIVDADRIVVVDGGHVVEQGTFAALLRRPDGVFAELWALQSGGVAVGGDDTADAAGK